MKHKDSGGRGNGTRGNATLHVDDVEVGTARVAKTVPFGFSSDDTSAPTKARP